MADPWRQHGAPIPVIYQADVENPDIETVALVTALRALFQLANDHSIEDLPSNANYDAAVEDLTSATHLFIETGKENRHRRGQPDIPRSERLRRPNEDVSRFEFGVCQGRELALSSQASRHLELSKPCLDLLDEVRKTNPKNRNIRSIEECACPSGTIDSSTAIHTTCQAIRSGSLAKI